MSMNKNSEPQTLIEAIRYFSDPDVCQDFMVSLRWPNGNVTCPTCGRDDVRYIATRRIWECKSKHPRRQFSIKIGTIFEDSPIGLDKWLAAIWMIANAKNGVSSYEIHRALGVTQKTAWFMLHRIRLAMNTDDLDPIRGEVEVDETFVGGKVKFMHKERRERLRGGAKRASIIGKTAVFGLLERCGPDGHSHVQAKVIANTRRRVLQGEVRRHVVAGSDVFTDANQSYVLLKRWYEHQVIDHGEEYVRGRVHTNGIENFWSLLKRAIKGTYVSIEPFHLFRYLDEQCFRYNTRKDVDAGRFERVVGSITGRRLTYKHLIGAATTPA
jgi:transposase-like protein